jgi:hypothetical protein
MLLEMEMEVKSIFGQMELLILREILVPKEEKILVMEVLLKCQENKN